MLHFIKETDVCNFAGDITLYKCGRDLDIVSEKLEMDGNKAINCLGDNEMVANLKKFQLMFLARNKSIEKEMFFVGKAINKIFLHSWVTRHYIRQKFKF